MRDIFTQWSLSFDQRRDFGSAQIDAHRFFICGGHNSEKGPLRSCHVWDCEKNYDKRVKNLPNDGMAFCRAVCIDNYVYILGSEKTFHRINVDDTSKGWEEMAELSSPPGYGHDLVVCDKKIYQIGGKLQPSSVNCYDPAKNAWIENKSQLLKGRTDLTAVVVEESKEIYIIGGVTVPGNSVVRSVDIFSVRDKTLRSGPPLPNHSRDHSSFSAGKNGIFVIGGHVSGSQPPVTDILHLDTSSKKQTEWTFLKHKLPKPLIAHNTFATEFKLYVMGGIHDTKTKYNKEIYVCDLDALLGKRFREEEEELNHLEQNAPPPRKSFCFFC